MTIMGMDGSVQQILPDGITAAALHNQFIGNSQGFSELQRILDNRKAELEDILKQQKQDEQSAQT